MAVGKVKLPEAGTNTANRAAVANQLTQPGSGTVFDYGTNSYRNVNGTSSTIDPTGRVVPSTYVQTGPNSYAQIGAPSDTSAATANRAAAQRQVSGALSGLISAQPQPQSYAPISAGSIPHVQRPSTDMGVTDANAAQSAAFGAAKAKAGSLGRSSLESLRAELADRGWLGGGTEARGLVDRLAAATNPLSDLNVAALHENVGLGEAAKGRAEHAADSIFSGDVTQRSQDVQMRAQDIQAQESVQQRNQQALQGLLSAFSKLY